MKRALPVLVALTLLAGCVGLPTAGPVQEGLERAPEPEGIVFLAPDPRPGGDPEEIVSGFLDAATAGVADRFETAQKYLTDSARRTWIPGAGVTVYAGSTPPEVQEDRPGRVTVTVPVAGFVDARGTYTEEPADTTKSFRFQLTQVDGQWRITSLDDGVLISAVNFGTQYRQVPLAFFSADGEYIVPDTRWFPEQNSASFAVSALLDGPAQWLLPGVVTAIPPGTSADPVSVSDGTAEVILSQAALAASPEDRAMIVAQLEHTLTQLPQVRRVRALVNDIPLLDGSHGLNPISDPAVGHNPVILRSEDVATTSGAAITPLEGIHRDPGADYTALAVPYTDIEDGDLPLVARIGEDIVATLPREGEEPAHLIEGRGLLGPSYDPFGWVWSGPKDSDGTLVVADPISETVSTVSAPALEDNHVRRVRVSRDGSRIALIQTIGEETAIQVAMVIRDEDGIPTAVSEPVAVGASVSDATDLTWVDSVTLAVLGSSEGGAPTVHTIPLGGPSVALLSVTDASSLTSGRGERELWVATETGEVFNRAGNGWRRVGEESDAIAIAFPG